MSVPATSTERIDDALTRRRSVARQGGGRRLHLGHFAFMRALVQGVDLREAWQRYLGTEGDVKDLRLIKGTVTWIRDEFAAAAKREGRPGTGRLVLIDVSKIPDPGEKLPSLEEFAQSAGLEDESERDQLDAYVEKYGKASQRQRRRARLLAKQLEAIDWLEQHVAQPPRAGDAVASWIHPALAQRLNAVDIFTLAQLVERVNGLGQQWARSVEAIGQAKSQRIVAWLREHQASIGIPVGAHVSHARAKLLEHELRAVVLPATDIRPLEKFIVPADLDGRSGAFRRPQEHCLLKASNDYEAIVAWLKSKQGLAPEAKAKIRARRRTKNAMGQGITTLEAAGAEKLEDWLQVLSHTQRAYRKEAERFLLWAIVQKGKPLSSMTNEDCIEYRDFLADPQPKGRWCGKRSRERWSPLWRPFEGPLSPAAQRQATTILKNLYGFLVDQNYLMGNPWSAVSIPKGSAPKVNSGRSLSLDQWRFVQEQLGQLPDTSTSHRLKFALNFLYATGLRLSEAVAAKVDDLIWVQYPPDSEDAEPLDGWILKVIGKGQKEREVPVPIEVVSQLAQYLASRGLDADPEDIGNQGAHLLGKAADAADLAPGLVGEEVFDPRVGIAATTLYLQLKDFFKDCAKVLRAQGEVKGADRLAKASTHWLRHTHASHAIASGMEVQVAQQNLGHASLGTTTIYVTTEQKKRLKAVGKFWSSTANAAK